MARPIRRPSATSERILDAALARFGTRGYEATSLDALAAELGITKQTILYWFGSKDGVLQAVVERIADELAATSRPPWRGSRQRLRPGGGRADHGVPARRAAARACWACCGS